MHGSPVGLCSLQDVRLSEIRAAMPAVLGPIPNTDVLAMGKKQHFGGPAELFQYAPGMSAAEAAAGAAANGAWATAHARAPPTNAAQ